MSRIIVIVGPTGVGKTRLSIELAKKLDASVINADAVSIYKDANIGSAKITKEEMENITHHMIDVASLDKYYTVRDYQRDARNILDKLIEEDKNVIIVGGSGLFTKALLYDYKFEDEEEDNISYDNLTNEELKQKVDEIYIDNNIHVNNRKRLERFLSHYEKTGNIIKSTLEKDKPIYDFTIIGLTADRKLLYEHINKRVDEMISKGLIDEVKKLKDYKKIKDIIGYKEIIKYLDNEITKEEAIEEIKKNTRKYAKRQYTWYNTQMKDVVWFETNYNDFDKTIKKIEAYLSL